MTDYPEQVRRAYYADFEVREACIATALIGGVIGLAIGVMFGWWTA